MVIEIDHVKLVFPPEISLKEAKAYLAGVDRANLIELELELDGDFVITKPKYNTIKRVRRITGYLSDVNNFNPAKRAEEQDRVKHFKGGN